MHPNEIRLSLYAGGELALLERGRTGFHVQRCENCRLKVEAMQVASAALRRAANELPGGLNWDRLAAEMTGNIRVGLAAGECISVPPRKGDRLGWRAAAVVASATLLIMTAWWLNIPPSRRSAANSNVVRLEVTASGSGIELKQNGAALTLLNQSAGSGSTVFVSSPGSLRARYVNAETGQMTINNVYAQ
jgi:hypothetical protein